MMNIFKMLNFYNFYKYVIKDIKDQNCALTYIKQSTSSVILKRNE